MKKEPGTPDSKKIIAALYLCAAKCDDCYNACLTEKNRSAFERCMMFCEDCSELCKLTAMLFEKNSENAVKYLRFCEEIASECTREFEKHGNAHIMDCAITCKNFSNAGLSIRISAAGHGLEMNGMSDPGHHPHYGYGMNSILPGRDSFVYDKQ